MPKLNMKKVPVPNATNHKIISTTRVANGIGFQPPNVLIRKWMNPTIGIPITIMPDMDINEVVKGERLTID